MSRLIQRKWGWRPDVPDFRDYLYSAIRRIKRKLPVFVDMRPTDPPIYDQGNLGSCTANALNAAHQVCQMKQPGPIGQPGDFIPSRLFLYYNEREMEGSVDEDAGAYIRDGAKSLSKQGVCPESEWPYDESAFTDKPSAKCYLSAAAHQVISYHRLRNTNLNELKACLAEGFPFVFGFAVYSSFQSPAVERTGIVPMPGRNDYMLGGHAVVAVGYTDSDKRFIVRNSWGESWGKDGYMFMPYDYLTDLDLADDFWTIRMVEE